MNPDIYAASIPSQCNAKELKISDCKHAHSTMSTIESTGYENRMSGAVRGRRLVTASYSIPRLGLIDCTVLREDSSFSFDLNFFHDFA